MKISPQTEKMCFFALVILIILAIGASQPMLTVGIVLGGMLEEKMPAIWKWYDDLKRKRGW